MRMMTGQREEFLREKNLHISKYFFKYHANKKNHESSFKSIEILKYIELRRNQQSKNYSAKKIIMTELLLTWKTNLKLNLAVLTNSKVITDVKRNKTKHKPPLTLAKT